jgi:ribonuclease R
MKELPKENMTTELLSREAVIEALGRIVTPGAKVLALADDMGLRKPQYAALRAMLIQLVEEGIAELRLGGAFALLPTGRKTDNKSKRGRRASVVKAPDEYFNDEIPDSPEPLRSVSATMVKAKIPTKSGKPGSGKGKPTQAKAGKAATSKLPWQKPAPANVVAPAAAKKSKGPAAPVYGSVIKREEYTAPEYTPEPRPSSKVSASVATDSNPVSFVASPIKSGASKPSVVAGPPTGRITVHPAGYGFVVTDDKQTVFVPAKYRGNSLDGDRVVLSTWEGVKGTEGQVDEVVARGRARLTGIVRKAGRAMYLEPDDPRIAADYGRVGIEGGTVGKDGESVVIEITRYPTALQKELAGRVLKVLGDPDDPRTEIEKILACACLPLEFPPEVAQAAERTPQKLSEKDFIDRIDLRTKRFCTIDPETARDFDDALCIEDGPLGGTRVWVAVADVSHYVRWGDALDRESSIRGVSVYLPDRVISMLPRQLSAGICSLNPDVERCAMVVRLDFTNEGELHDTSYAAAVIRSHGRLDYPGVAAALGGDFRGHREHYRPWLAELERLNALAQVLRAKRRARGALELEVPEPKVILDADDPRLVRDVVRAKGDPAVKGAYELVEEFMIGANEAVGAFFKKRGLTAVWRVHAPPQLQRVELLAQLLESYGIVVDVDAARTPLGMKAVLDQVNENTAARSLSFLVLRTLTQAVWGIDPVGHFGLASADYLHFTSPIRRYPDLLVHRLLKHYLHREGKPSGGGYAAVPPAPEELAALAAASSGFERRAIEAEREAVAMYRAYLMRDRVGEQFPGVVSAVTSFGVFVEIEDPFVEGLVKNDQISGDTFDFDQVHMRLSGRRTGRSIQLGDAVIVELINVSVGRRRIEMQLLSGGSVRERNEAAAPGGFAARRRTAKTVDKAQRSNYERQPGNRPGETKSKRSTTGRTERAERSATGGSGNGKLRLRVSHGTDSDRPGSRPKFKVRRGAKR